MQHYTGEHMKLFRQGDVLLQQVKSLPKGAKDETPQGRIVLAFGEVTGHAHAIENEHKSCRYWSAEGERFLQVLTTSELRHEEHSTVTLPPGIYKLPQQMEYKPQELKRVAD